MRAHSVKAMTASLSDLDLTKHSAARLYDLAAPFQFFAALKDMPARLNMPAASSKQPFDEPLNLHGRGGRACIERAGGVARWR